MDEDKISRRSVLNGAMSTVALGFGVSGKAAADERPENVDQIVKSQPVQRILDKLNYPTVESATAQNYVNSFERRSADNPSTILLSTEAGEIAYTEVPKSDDVAIAHIEPDQAREVIPQSHRGEKLVLSAVGDELTQLRSANPGEVNRVKKATKSNLIDNDTVLFRVIGSDKFRAVKDLDNQESPPELYEVQFENTVKASKNASVEVERIDPLGTEGPVTLHDHDCQNICVNCLAMVGGCVPCWAALPGVVTVPGAIAWLTCINTICGIALPAMCGQCLDCGT